MRRTKKLIQISGTPAELAERIYRNAKNMGKAMNMETAYYEARKMLEEKNKQIPKDWGFKL